ncbi:metal-sulfur cluster assembly factor [Methanolobus sediminis]|uniref:Metal-sulfur cluster assembly factor n=1 Tax=Methanolobus sediminis TaxID=3072978 RepID=A0AA51UMV4_9EURY|nr:metal-sulfur cluster assembly factor [Methanolobus sediminis]WMW26239.1 metal-sulfur cluster assembly factor [Methanolobus sediminis]
MVTEEEVMDVLRECYDPEIPINIVDLGFVRDIEIEGDSVHIKLTLTSPGCPMYRTIGDDVRQKVLGIEGVRDVEVEFVFDTQWTPDEMSDKAKKKMGFDEKEG